MGESLCIRGSMDMGDVEMLALGSRAGTWVCAGSCCRAGRFDEP